MDVSSLSKETLLRIIEDQQKTIDTLKRGVHKGVTRVANEADVTYDKGKCRCRIWDGFPNKQCSRRPTLDGYCGIHDNHRVKWGTWHLGEIDGPKPTQWGEFGDYVPCGERQGGRIRKS